MNLAAFAVVGMLQRDPARYGGLASFAGLAGRAPALAAAMAVLLLSLTGIPPTVGFFAKLYVLLASVDAGLGWLAVIIALNAALAAFYYLRVIVYMYMRDPEADPGPGRPPSPRHCRARAVGGRRAAARRLPGADPEPAFGTPPAPSSRPWCCSGAESGCWPELRGACSATGGC